MPENQSQESDQQQPPQLPTDTTNPDNPAQPSQSDPETPTEQSPETLQDATGNWPSHMSIVGLPRTGKTTLAAKLFRLLSKNNGCVFCNLQAEPYFEGFIPVRRVNIPSVLAGESFVWNADPWEVKPFLVRLFLIQRASETLAPITIFVDEAHLVAPRGCFTFPEEGHINEDNIIGVLCTTGLKWNVRVVWISQRPQFVDSGVYRTARYHVFFTVDTADVDYFRQQGFIFVNPEWHDYVVVRS